MLYAHKGMKQRRPAVALQRGIDNDLSNPAFKGPFSFVLVKGRKDLDKTFLQDLLSIMTAAAITKTYPK